MERIAIFGGTFDPVHWGHLMIAQTALQQLALKRVIWVPTVNPPHKVAAAFEHRMRMVEIAIADNPAFAISPVKIQTEGISYAIDTLIAFADIYPHTHWYWIVGLDTFQTLPRWYRSAELASLCDWLIAPRTITANQTDNEQICSQVEQQLKAKASSIHWQLLHMPIVGISSSLIRKLCCDHKSIRYLLPEAVRRYIDIHNLYLEPKK